MKKREDHQFDEQVRQKMSNLRAGTGMPDWEAFEERLDAAEGLNAGPAQADPREVDEVIFTKMHQYEVPYEPAHWHRMEGKLNEWFTWPQYVLRYKSMELALFLLLFITCWQYLPKMGAPAADAAPAQEESYTAASSSTAPPQTEGSQEAQAQKAPSAATEAAPLQAAPSARAVAPAASAEQNAGQNSSIATPPPASSSGAQHLSALKPLPALLLPVRSFADNTNGILPEVALRSAERDAASATALLPGLPLKALPALSADLGDTKVKRIRRKPIFVVGMFGSADYNHIVVPASAEKRLAESFERAALGYGGGISISADFGRLEVETGAIYAARYYPVGIVYVRGSLLSGLRGDELRTTELNMVNIPLHLRYDYVQRDKWRAYVLGGGSLQVAFQANYYTAEARQFDFMPALPPPVTDGGGESEIDRIRRNGKGWLEDGSFEDNAYITLNFGFGAERYFSERWSLFVQPVYQHSVHYFKGTDGLGPNNDRINSFSVLFGTRVRLR